MTSIAQVILVRRDRALILADINGVIGSIAGSPISSREAPRDAALRAVTNATNLDAGLEDLIFWRQYQQTYYFTIHHVVSSRLQTAEDINLAIIHNEAEACKINTTPRFRRVLTDYYHDLRHVHVKNRTS